VVRRVAASLTVFQPLSAANSQNMHDTFKDIRQMIQGIMLGSNNVWSTPKKKKADGSGLAESFDRVSTVRAKSTVMSISGNTLIPWRFTWVANFSDQDDKVLHGRVRGVQTHQNSKKG